MSSLPARLASRTWSTALAANNQTFNPGDQGQRGALAIVDGVLFVPYGGHFGDCGEYHELDQLVFPGWPSSRGELGQRARGVAASGRQVASARTVNRCSLRPATPSMPRRGVTVRPFSAYLPISVGLIGRQDYFAPVDWYELDRRDADLGGTILFRSDVPTENGTQALVLALGKDGRAYLLDRNDLGGIGGSLVAETVSNRAIRTAPVTYPTADGVFVAFQAEGARCPTSHNEQKGLIGLWLTIQ